jgi:hypothetical protein
VAMQIHVTRWHSPTESPDPDRLLEGLRASGRDYASWGNGPEDTYAVHTHPYRKHLVCLRGSITFTLPASGKAVELRPGDELDLPPGVAHGALVGPDGVRCAEAHLGAT